MDINPNSVKICRLRLWIELLKNAYYKNATELETLPNIDINIKCGNSLVSRFAIDADLGQALKKSKWTIDSYRLAVDTYRNAESKEQKREMERLITSIKSDFRSEITKDDPKLKRLSKLNGELFNLTNQDSLFEMEKKQKALWTKQIEKLTSEVKKLDAEIEEIKANKIYENAFEWRFEFPEVLNDAGDFVGFDVVIGNPPYGALLDQVQKIYFKEKYNKSFNGNFDVYVFFIEKAFDLLNNNKLLTYITPDTWLNIPQAFNLRKFVLGQADITNIISFDFNVFEEANVNTIIFRTEKIIPNKKAGISISKSNIIEMHSSEETIYNEILIQRWRSDTNYSININQTDSINQILTKILQNSTRAINLLDVSQGIIPYSKEIHGIENVKNRFFHSPTKLTDEFGIWVQGRAIKRYSVAIENHEFIKYGSYLHRPRKPKYFEGKRILIQEITGGIPPSISASIYINKLYHDPGIISCLGTTDLPLEYILGILNSKLISWYHRVNSPKGKRNQFPKILINDVRELPINVNLEYIESLCEMVKTISALKSNNSLKDTTQIDNEIDKLVYKIYNLNDEEIKIIQE